MGNRILEWLKKDLQRDVKRIRKYPERFIAVCFFTFSGGFLLYLGLHWMNLPLPSTGHEYVTDYYFQGFISFVISLVFIGISLMTYSTMSLEERDYSYV